LNQEEGEAAVVEEIAGVEEVLVEVVAAEEASQEVGEDSNRVHHRLLLKLPLSPTPAKANLSQ